jgi:hypothetical protein
MKLLNTQYPKLLYTGECILNILNICYFEVVYLRIILMVILYLSKLVNINNNYLILVCPTQWYSNSLPIILLYNSFIMFIEMYFLNLFHFIIKLVLIYLIIYKYYFIMINLPI